VGRLAKFLNVSINVLVRRGGRKTYSHHDLDLVELGLTKFHNLRMQAHKELRDPLMEGVLRQNPSLPRAAVAVQGKAWALDERRNVMMNGGNEGETFGNFQSGGSRVS